jgi:hypothetical protein
METANQMHKLALPRAATEAKLKTQQAVMAKLCAYFGAQVSKTCPSNDIHPNYGYWYTMTNLPLWKFLHRNTRIF